ncbi:MAG: alpha-L-fucosidase [Bacteroidota bacterium]|nr:alpha-L-fucosidase [Bacteroidota bacterium]
MQTGIPNFLLLKTNDVKKLLLAFVLLLTQLIGNSQPRFQADWESLQTYQIPDWFRDAKFGIFLHWGVYSVPGFESEWYPRNMYQKGSKVYEHHIKTYGTQDKFGYKDFIPMFTAEKFNADEWVELFKEAGAKYVVPVAEHHDGFAMYKSALTRWNAFEMGPKRDVVGEIAAAAKKAGLVLGVSSHRIEHWFFMSGGKKFNSDVMDPAYDDFYGPAHEEKETPSPEYMNDWLMRNIELVDKYQPQLFWFDWWIENPAMAPYRKSFASYYYNKSLEWKKGVVINYKHESFPDKAAVLDIERGKLTDTRPLAWQTDDAIGYKSWGYIAGEEFKSAKYLINNLVDIVSKNGNLLLNIGPAPDGTISQKEQDILKEVGAWLKVNGEAIYGSRPWKKFGEGPTQVAGGQFSDNKDKPFTAADVRFTTKDKVLYATTLDNPAQITIIKNLSQAEGKIKSVDMLGSDQKVQWTQAKDGLRIQPSASYPAKWGTVYKIVFE